MDKIMCRIKTAVVLTLLMLIMIIFAGCGTEYFNTSTVGQGVKGALDIQGTWMAENFDTWTFTKGSTFTRTDKNGESTEGIYNVLDGNKLLVDYSNSSKSATYIYEVEDKTLTLENNSTGHKTVYYGDKEKVAELKDKKTLTNLYDITASYYERMKNADSNERIEIKEQYRGSIDYWKAQLDTINDKEGNKKKIKLIEENIWNLEWYLKNM